MTNTLGYIIVATRDDGTRWYMAIDRPSGGYEYFTAHAPSAEFYPDSGEAERQIKRRMGDTFLHKATGADFSNPARRVHIGVEVVSASAVGYVEAFSFDVNTVIASRNQR